MAAIALILISLPISLAILNPIDYLALQSIHKSLLDLPGSTFLASWDFTADPCSFPGVLCSRSRVVALALGDPRASSPGLAGRLDPLAFSHLAALAELSLVPGHVSGPIPSPLPLDLTFLALANNLLSGPIPRSLPFLRRLRTLDLSGNRLSGPIPAALVRLPHLANLILAHNHLSFSIPSPTSPLIRLDLKHNLLTGTIPPLPRSIRYLALSSNALTGHVDHILQPLSRLNYLDLSMNRLSGGIPGCIFSFPISDLRLQRNGFSGPIRPAGPLAATVDRVDLSHNRFNGPVPAELAAAAVVFLNDNLMTGVVPGVFVERVMGGAIRVLYLQRNYLTGIGKVGGATSEVPPGTAVCLQYNCMVPPEGAACPVRGGRHRTRPAAECPRWKKG